MQVFKAFIKVMRKKLSTAFIYIGIFLVIAVSMTKSGQNPAELVFKSVKLGVVVFDEDNTPESRSLREFIGTRHNLKELDKDTNLIKDTLYMGMNTDIHVIMTIKKGYAEKLRAQEYDDLFENYHIHDSYYNILVGQLLDEYVSSVRAYQTSGRPLSDAISDTERVLSVETKVTIRKADGEQNSEETSPLFDDYFRYLPYILLSVLIEVLCPVLLAMGKKNIRYRTNCSSVRSSSYTLQIILGSTLLVVAVWFVFIIAGFGVFGMFHGTAWFSLLNSFLFAMIAVSLSVLIASFNPSELVVNLMAQILGLGMSFLCGIFVPMEWLGEGVIRFSRFLPAYWYVKANEIICGKIAFDGGKLGICLMIEAGFAVAFALISIVVRRAKYNSSAQLN